MRGRRAAGRGFASLNEASGEGRACLEYLIPWLRGFRKGAVALHCVLTTAETADEAVKIKY